MKHAVPLYCQWLGIPSIPLRSPHRTFASLVVSGAQTLCRAAPCTSAAPTVRLELPCLCFVSRRMLTDAECHDASSDPAVDDLVSSHRLAHAANAANAASWRLFAHFISSLRFSCLVAAQWAYHVEHGTWRWLAGSQYPGGPTLRVTSVRAHQWFSCLFRSLSNSRPALRCAAVCGCGVCAASTPPLVC